MNAIKLNFRHSLKTMNSQLKQHNEAVVCYGQGGKIVHEIREEYEYSGKLTQTCAVFYNAKDCAEYINSRNGF